MPKPPIAAKTEQTPQTMALAGCKKTCQNTYGHYTYTKTFPHRGISAYTAAGPRVEHCRRCALRRPEKKPLCGSFLRDHFDAVFDGSLVARTQRLLSPHSDSSACMVT